MSKRAEKRAKSDGSIVSGSAADGAPAGRHAHSFSQGFPAITNNQVRSDGSFAPMTYWGLRQQKREEEKDENKTKTTLDKDLEERLKSFVMSSPKSPRSFSVDATGMSSKLQSPRDRSSLSGAVGGVGGASRRGSNFGVSGKKNKQNPSLTADAGLSPQQILWLKRIAP